jgi:DNA-binding transcriptional regulator YdaS (Cro superfamily)
VHKSKRVPAEYVLLVEKATGVSRHKLRPDLYPAREQAA